MPVSFAHVRAKVKHNHIEEKRAAINKGSEGDVSCSQSVRVVVVLWPPSTTHDAHKSKTAGYDHAAHSIYFRPKLDWPDRGVMALIEGMIFMKAARRGGNEGRARIILLAVAGFVGVKNSVSICGVRNSPPAGFGYLGGWVYKWDTRQGVCMYHFCLFFACRQEVCMYSYCLKFQDTLPV